MGFSSKEGLPAITWNANKEDGWKKVGLAAAGLLRSIIVDEDMVVALNVFDSTCWVDFIIIILAFKLDID